MSNDIPLGAHLVSGRGMYSHHGIYVGDGRVVQYSGLSKSLSAGPVEEVSLWEFTQGKDYDVRPRPDAVFDRNEIVRRARSRVGEAAYNVLANNCEHFCEWCITGDHKSRQVDTAVTIVSASFAAPVAVPVVRAGVITGARVAIAVVGGVAAAPVTAVLAAGYLISRLWK